MAEAAVIETDGMIAAALRLAGEPKNLPGSASKIEIGTRIAEPYLTILFTFFYQINGSKKIFKRFKESL